MALAPTLSVRPSSIFLGEWTDLRCALREKGGNIKVVHSRVTRRILADTRCVAAVLAAPCAPPLIAPLVQLQAHGRHVRVEQLRHVHQRRLRQGPAGHHGQAKEAGAQTCHCCGVPRCSGSTPFSRFRPSLHRSSWALARRSTSSPRSSSAKSACSPRWTTSAPNLWRCAWMGLLWRLLLYWLVVIVARTALIFNMTFGELASLGAVIAGPGAVANVAGVGPEPRFYALPY